MKVLVVEDDNGLRDVLTQGLRDGGHQVTPAIDAGDAMALCENESFDIHLLDILLPDSSGTVLCRWLRERGIKQPIWMVTALSGSSDKVAGLDAGADDYLTKPFDLAEINARLRAQERKAQGYPRPECRVGDLVLNPNTEEVSRGGTPLDLSKKEYTLLEYLVRHRDTVVTRAMIAKNVWSSQTNLYTNVIDVYLNYLRKKVDGEGTQRLIHTLRGKGVMVSTQEPGKP
jgi:two-component system response regulator MprA